MLEMSDATRGDIPLLKQGSLLIASVQHDLTDWEFQRFQSRLLTSISENEVGGVVVDVTGLDVIDSYGARTLRDLASMVRMRGASLAVVGIQPHVALTMVQLGLTMEGVLTALDLEEGIVLLEHEMARPT